jgi:acyl carrier protein
MKTHSQRYAALEAEVKAILQYLSGHSLEGVDTSASFFDLGFDSLLLTQASQSFRQKFGIKITFRQLMEELLSIAAVTAYLDEKVEPDKFAAPASSAPVAKSAPVVGAPLTPALPALNPTVVVDATLDMTQRAGAVGPAALRRNARNNCE